MKSIAVLIAGAILMFSYTFSAADEMPQQDKNATKDSVQTEETGNKICPITGEKIDKKISYEYNGKTYYFCCQACIDEFKEDPEKYIKKMEEGSKAESKQGQ